MEKRTKWRYRDTSVEIMSAVGGIRLVMLTTASIRVENEEGRRLRKGRKTAGFNMNQTPD